MRDLNIPTLVIVGDQDNLFPVEVAEHIAGAIPNAKLVTLRDCGHFSYLERPADVRNVLADFFRASATCSG